jgi:long-chain acyl-CoA synthetase
MTASSRNLVQVFEDQVSRRGDAAAMTFKRGGAWRQVSWNELGRRVRVASDGLASLGVQAGDRVSIMADTSCEWIIADLAILSAGAITVPIYQSNPAHEARYILNDAGSSWIFVDHEHQAAKIREEKASLPELRGLVASSATPGPRTSTRWPRSRRPDSNGEPRIPEATRRVSLP